MDDDIELSEILLLDDASRRNVGRESGFGGLAISPSVGDAFGVSGSFGVEREGDDRSGPFLPLSDTGANATAASTHLFEEAVNVSLFSENDADKRDAEEDVGEI